MGMAILYRYMGISIFSSITPEAAILKKGIDGSGNLRLEHFADAMVTLYHRSSDEIQHDKDPGDIVLQEEEWEIVFKDVKITNSLHQNAIKMALKTPTSVELRKLFNKSIEIVITI